ncbi:MAG: hypothetical protein OXI80_19505 [Caldilineaceae bacterium]|nr:hypothetical protein [Caldilineaceae bacterium]MDE0339869.1 hypothetical protein [Caldilineaceae bacterium]
MEPADRIWDQMHHALRLGKYYSELSFNLRKRYMWWSLFIISAPILALALVQIIPAEISNWAISILLLSVSLVEGYIAQSNLRGDISASRVMGVQFHKLAEKWRLLWIQQEREDIEEWIELLEDLTHHLKVEHLSSRDVNLNNQAMEDANYDYEQQFPETDAQPTSTTDSQPTSTTDAQPRSTADSTTGQNEK